MTTFEQQNITMLSCCNA